MSSVRRLGPALLLVLTAGATAARAQTVIVRDAPAGSTIEVTWNNGGPASAAADKNGDATLTVPGSPGDASAQVNVDTCGTTVRVALNAFGTAAALPDAGCTRKNQWGVYIMHATTTFVVQMNGTDSNVYVSQGPPPREWTARGEGTLAGKIHWDEPRKGLVLSAGAGYMWFLHTVERACGNVTDCERTNFPGGFSVSADFWITRNFAAYAALLRPVNQVIEGTGTGLRFDSHQQTRVAIIGGKAGFGAGPARLYGIAGFNHYEATVTTNETVDDQTLTVDGVTQVLKGATQTVGAKTKGWDWVFGGGGEAWFSKW